MRKIIILTFIISLPYFLSGGNAEGTDPIDQIANKLNSDIHGLWVNGGYPTIKLPADEKPENVIEQAIKTVGFDKGHIKTYKIIEVRKIKLNASGMENCSAALIESDLGKKVLLFKYKESSSQWWTRFFEIPEEK